jgi:hypothetical protein
LDGCMNERIPGWVGRLHGCRTSRDIKIAPFDDKWTWFDAFES